MTQLLSCCPAEGQLSVNCLCHGFRICTNKGWVGADDTCVCPKLQGDVVSDLPATTASVQTGPVSSSDGHVEVTLNVKSAQQKTGDAEQLINRCTCQMKKRRFPPRQILSVNTSKMSMNSVRCHTKSKCYFSSRQLSFVLCAMCCRLATG